MTLFAVLLVGALGAAGTGWALPRGGLTARGAAIAGVIALALIGILAALSPTPHAVTADAGGVAPGTLWNGAIAAGGYLRLVVVLAATTSIVMCALVWLLRGVPGLRGLLPASLAALVGTTVALGATNPQLAIVAAGATGLASIPALLASPRVAAAGVAAREVRIAVATALIVLAVAMVVPALARLVLANPVGDVASAGSGVAAAVACGLLVLALVVAGRVGAIPYHVRISALADTAPEGSLPLILAWLPLPLAAVCVGVAASALAPLALPVGSAQALIVLLALLATIAAAFAAGFQDDLRHAVGYLTLADLGLVVLAFAALDAAAWGPARTWLVTAAVTKSALFAWAAVAEDRFETRSVPDLRGWLRPSPMMGLALVLIVVATFGLPGWAVLQARIDLASLAAGGPWSGLLLVASLLTLPAYGRWLWLGVGAPTSHVDRATPEFLALGGVSGPARRLALRPPGRRHGRDEGLLVEQETSSPTISRSPSAPTPTGHPAASPPPAASRPRRAAPSPALRPGPSRPIEPSAAPESAGQGVTDLGARPARPVASRLGTRPKPASAPRPPALPEAGAVPERERGTVPETGAPSTTGSSKEPAASKPAAASKPEAASTPQAASKSAAASQRAATSLWAAPVPTIDPEATAQPTLFAAPELGPAPAPDASAPARPELDSVRPGTGMGRRSRTGNDTKRTNGKSGSSPMTAPRAPEASKAFPSALLAAEDELGSDETVVRPRRGRMPSGPDAATWVGTAARQHRADLLSTAVLALALLATLVAFGAFDLPKAACEPTQAVPGVSCT